MTDSDLVMQLRGWISSAKRDSPRQNFTCPMKHISMRPCSFPPLKDVSEVFSLRTLYFLQFYEHKLLFLENHEHTNHWLGPPTVVSPARQGKIYAQASIFRNISTVEFFSSRSEDVWIEFGAIASMYAYSYLSGIYAHQSDEKAWSSNVFGCGCWKGLNCGFHLVLWGCTGFRRVFQNGKKEALVSTDRNSFKKVPPSSIS